MCYKTINTTVDHKKRKWLYRIVCICLEFFKPVRQVSLSYEGKQAMCILKLF
jgi:hypothetical protein